jgi:hypothetical protein
MKQVSKITVAELAKMSDSYQIDRKKWAHMNILQQMGNIGSEVGRAISAKRCGDKERTIGAIARALDLFDATIEILVAQKSPRTREVLRARDQFLGLFFDDKFSDANGVERYFTTYAIAARNNN